MNATGSLKLDLKQTSAEKEEAEKRLRHIHNHHIITGQRRDVKLFMKTFSLKKKVRQFDSVTK